jgi:large subunit ribosomal protein L15
MAIALNDLRPARGANHKRKRVGRGMGSGHGKTATRGYKGQLSRSGTSMRPGFEGGQMPLYRRLPKRGFTNIFRKEFAIANVSDLAKFEPGSKIDPQVLHDRGIAKALLDGLKILGNGQIDHAIHVRAHRFSKSAIEKIQKAGGTIEVIGQ